MEDTPHTTPTRPQSTPFRILGYDFDQISLRARFYYRGGTAQNPLDFVETVYFSDRAKNSADSTDSTDSTENRPDLAVLDRALFFASIAIGTSYYKAFPTHEVILPPKRTLSTDEAAFFNTIYQDGLSQFTYENTLTRRDLAHFKATSTEDNAKAEDANTQTTSTPTPLHYSGSGKLVLQSGGKDSLLTAELLNKAGQPWHAVYISSTESYPQILDQIGADSLQIIKREIDKTALRTASELGGLNGHVPVTYINIAIALIQAIINGDNEIITSIGHEGAEPHAVIGSGAEALPVNHQWSKTAEAEQLLQNYIKNHLAPEFRVHSLIRKYSELKVAELFVDNCWNKYGHKFSSCNVANYTQGADNSKLRWCGRCAKCANSYLLFAPFLEARELNSLFPNGKSLFEVPDLTQDFKGLLGVDGTFKPFECVGEITELRAAYHKKGADYPDLPFSVPTSDFDYNQEY